jgi:hypothetical protein
MFCCSLGTGFVIQPFQAPICRYLDQTYSNTGADIRVRKMPTEQRHNPDSPPENVKPASGVSERFGEKKARAYARSFVLR